MTLTGCAGSGNKPSLSPIPADIKTCFDYLVPKPPAGALSKKQVVAVIADLKKSELRQSQCGKRLIAWYETQAAIFEGVKP